MKVIFLDIDGVLNSNEFYERRYKQKLNEYVVVDEELTKEFVKFLDENNIKLVISSTWRLDNVENTKRDFDSYVGLRLLNNYIVGVTPRSRSRFRGNEIKYFIDNTDLNIESYVIIDDDKDMLDEQKPYFIHIDNLIGLRKEDFKRILKILNKES